MSDPPASRTVELPVPTSLEQLTPAWMTAALAPGFPGTEVTAVTVGRSVRRFATNTRLLLEYDDTGHRHRLPATMFVKTDVDQDGGPALAAASAREVRYYSEVAGRVPINQPRCYLARTDARSGRSVLLLEDLLARNARFGSPTAPLAPTAVRDGLAQLAQLHAHWWDSPELDRLDTAPGTLRTAVLGLLADGAWAAALSRPSGGRIPDQLRDGAVMRWATERMWDHNLDGPHCLVHGDPHLGNTFVDADGRIGFLDWQAAARGSWAYDVTRYLVGSLTVADRRAAERSLLDGYLQELAGRGVAAPDPDVAWLAYRRNILHGLRWVCTPLGGYPEPSVAAYLTRFAIAATDLDALASLGSP